MGCIYMITKIINNKKYIGQTKNTAEARFKDHLRSAKNCKYNNHFYNAIRKYGPSNFKLSILKDNIDELELDYWEIYYIEKFDTIKSGYNSTKGGVGIRGYKFTKEQKQHQSEAALKSVSKRITPERNKKISNALKGRTFTTEHKEKLSKQAKKRVGHKNPFFGKKHTEITKAKLSKQHKKAVLQIDPISNEIINRFSCAKDAAEYVSINNFNIKVETIRDRILRRCSGITQEKPYLGFLWKYDE